ncbi:MAG: nucleotide sugar dehydrogenase [Bacteroidales bacterium]|nr:nucleotide sugar dehydrogenase [Bacteroidales bacterium]
MVEKLKNREAKVSVLGLGYVGLPIALELAKHFSVIGFDIREDRIEQMQNGIDPSKELSEENFKNRDITFTTDARKLKEAHFHIIAVPTPIDDHNLPDLEPLLSATATLSNYLKKGDYVVYESTVYPGCTEEECIPLLEKESGLKLNEDFKVGYSPERINPGDTLHTLTKVIKVVSGSDEEALHHISEVYKTIIEAGVHPVSAIKVAEAAKIIENTQRDINIAFMNELSIIFSRMNINTFEVLEAAGTKWNFLKFSPGLVGGHCIGVDPYYLTYKSGELGYHAQIITAGRFINDSMGGYIAKQVVKKLIATEKILQDARILVMGITFKENVSDIRNSKVVNIIRELNSFGLQTDVTDPYAEPEQVLEEYGIELTEPEGTYDAVVVAVGHNPYVAMEEIDFAGLLDKNGVFVDVKGVFRKKIRNFEYWSL